MAEATALVERVELKLPDADDRVVVGFRRNGCASVFFGPDPVYQFTTDDITAVIGVSGALEGNVLYGFHKDTARSVVSKMMESEVTEFDEMALSALGEIANMITGNAATGILAPEEGAVPNHYFKIDRGRAIHSH